MLDGVGLRSGPAVLLVYSLILVSFGLYLAALGALVDCEKDYSSFLFLSPSLSVLFAVMYMTKTRQAAAQSVSGESRKQEAGSCSCSCSTQDDSVPIPYDFMSRASLTRAIRGR